MLGTALLMAMSRDKRGLLIAGIFLLVLVLATIAWNLAP